MKSVKVKELKDDAVVNISVNKTYYVMVKAILFHLFTIAQKENDTKELLENITKKSYNELQSDIERSFYTLTLLLAEIENQAVKNNLFEEKEVTEETIKIPDEETKD